MEALNDPRQSRSERPLPRPGGNVNIINMIVEAAKALMDLDDNSTGWENATDKSKHENILAVVTAIAAIEASGYAVVPVEPTEEMRKCEFHYAFKTPEDVPPKFDWRPDVVYKLMLAARPKVTP